MWASNNGHLAMAKYLIGAKANVNAQDVSRMWSALFISESSHALKARLISLVRFMCMFGDNVLVLNVAVHLAVWFARTPASESEWPGAIADLIEREYSYNRCSRKMIVTIACNSCVCKLDSKYVRHKNVLKQDIYLCCMFSTTVSAIAALLFSM